MTWNQRVIWSEGLFLQPQHFQQHDRFVEHLMRSHARATHAWGWGCVSLTIDPVLLEIGKVAIASAFGLMPDGTPFCFPDDLPAPEPVDIPPDTKDELVMLCVPLSRRGAKEFDIGLLCDGEECQPNGSDLRYRVSETEVADSVAGSSLCAHMQTASPNFRLMLSRNATDAYASIGIARVVERGADHRVVLDPGYIPPTLDANRQTVLSGYLRELCARVHQHAELHAANFSQAGRGGIAEIADFLLLMMLNRYEPLMEHLRQAPLIHPSRLYEALLAFAGELSTFSEDRRPLVAAQYRHDDLAAAFRSLMHEIRESPAWRIEPAAVAIALSERAPSLHVATIHDLSLMKSATFVLAAHAQMPPEAMRARLPAQVKIAPAERIREIATLALPGIRLRPLPVAPRQIPFHAGFDYFELERDSELWKQLEKSGNAAMHVSGDFPGLELEFWAIRP